MTATRSGIIALALALAAVPAFAQPAPPPRKPPVPGAAEPAPQGPAAPAPKAAETLTGPAAPKDSWDTRAVTGADGALTYCITQARYDSGHVLVMARTPDGEVNLALGIPGGALPAGERWGVTVIVDGTLSRETQAVAAKGDLLVIPAGRDDELYDRLGTGRELAIRSSADRIAFQLKGTKKALADLRACSTKAGSGFPAPAAEGASTESPYPETLTAVLAAAGFRQIEPLSLDGVPEDRREADYAWRIGPIVGGVRETPADAGTTLDALTDAYVAKLKGKCEGAFTPAVAPVETLAGLSLRPASVGCVRPDGPVHIALLFYLTEARLFTVFFHEGKGTDSAEADAARDAIARVIRDLAATAAPAAPAPPVTPR